MRRFVVAGVAGFVAVAGAAVPATAGPVTPSRPGDGAVMVGWHEQGDSVDGLRAHEAELGTRFALVRMYQQWQLPARKVATMINDNRLVLVSHKPPAGGWAAVASGAEDAMIEAMAEAYRSFGHEVLFSFHHEPHDDASDVKGGTSGTAADYRAAWRRIRGVFDRVGASHSAGGNVFFAYSATGSWALKAGAGGSAGSGDPLYPGDDLVDVFAHDRYNWASCRGDAWEEFASEWAPLVALAAAHRKPLIAAEFGSPPAAGARNDWFRRAATWLRTDPLARRWMWGFAYYHSLHDTCPWDFLSHGDDGRLGWQDAFRDPYFTGTPFSLASVPSPPTIETTTNPGPPPATGRAPLRPAAPGSTKRTAPTTTTSSVPPAAGRGSGDPTVPAGAGKADGSNARAAEPAPGAPLQAPATAASPVPTGAQPAGPPPPPPPAPPRSSSSTPGAALFVGLVAVVAAALVGRRMITA
ncbi:MAG: hypothetical protein AB1679_33870 [Actinomycetota bacterium]